MRGNLWRFLAAGTALVGSGMGIVHQGAVMASEPVTLHYYLTRVDVGAAVSQTLTGCHDDGRLEVVTNWQLSADGAPDYDSRVDIDVSPSFLVERETGLKLYPNETLASFNAASTGQGGAVLSAALSAAASLAPLLVGVPVPIPPAAIMGVDGDPPPPPPLRILPPPPKCNVDTLKLLADRTTLLDEIDQLENAIFVGTATRHQVEQLARKRLELLSVERKLTITQSIEDVARKFTAACVRATPASCAGSVYVPRFNYRPWLDGPDSEGTNRPNNFGFVVRWEPSRSSAPADLSALPTEPVRELLYLRPVPGLMVGYACADGNELYCERLKGPAGAAAFGQLEFAIPQLSPIYRLPLGGGIFGGRSVEAEFDELGRPTRLSFGSDPGGESIASTIGAASDAIVGIDGARLAALNAEIEMEEALANFEALTKPPEPSADPD